MHPKGRECRSVPCDVAEVCHSYGIRNYHGLLGRILVGHGRYACRCRWGQRTYIGLHVHTNLLLDGRTALQRLDARLQVLLLVVTAFGNPRTNLILAGLDLQSRYELATRVMLDTQGTKDDRKGECSDATYCFVHFLLLVNETLIVVSDIGLGRSL